MNYRQKIKDILKKVNKSTYLEYLYKELKFRSS